MVLLAPGLHAIEIDYNQVPVATSKLSAAAFSNIVGLVQTLVFPLHGGERLPVRSQCYLRDVPSRAVMVSTAPRQ